MRKALCCLLLLVLAACSAGGASNQGLSTLPQTGGRTVETVAASGVTWNLGAGASTDSYANQDLDFFPRTITIDAGDTLTWHFASGVGGDAHTVAFLGGQPLPSPANPNDVVPAGGSTYDGSTFTNSGIKFGGQTYSLTFPKAGTFKYYCLFHEPAMEGTVIVQNAKTAYPHSAQYYLNQSENDEWDDFALAAISVRSFPFPVGGTTFAAGISPGLGSGKPTDSTILRFFNTNQYDKLQSAAAGNKTIKVGTTLTWVNESNNEPHTVTFPVAGQDDLPNIPTDPGSGGTTFDGSHLVNSGSLLGGQSFSLTFTKAGTYFYGCLYHDNSRMTGIITVTN